MVRTKGAAAMPRPLSLGRVALLRDRAAPAGEGAFLDKRHATGLTVKAAFQTAVSTGETPVVSVSAAKMAAFPVSPPPALRTGM